MPQLSLNPHTCHIGKASAEVALRSSTERVTVTESTTKYLGSETRPPKAAVTCGDILAGRYRIERLLGRGGQGEVHAATDRLLHRRVAVKILTDSHGDALPRLIQEAIAIAQIRHRAVPEIYDAAVRTAADYDDAAQPFIVMEYLHGVTLSERLRSGGAIPVHSTIAIASEIFSAAAAAHAQGIIHRDIKPGNVMLAEHDDGSIQPKLLDFGIAKLRPQKNLSPLCATQRGLVMGTFAYLAPEQLDGSDDREVETSVDIWALGVLLFEMLVGEHPYAARTSTELIAKIVSSEPRDIGDVAGHIPRPLQALVRSCLSKDAAKRPSAQQAVERLVAIGLTLDFENREAYHRRIETWGTEARGPQSGHDVIKRPLPNSLLLTHSVLTLAALSGLVGPARAQDDAVAHPTDSDAPPSIGRRTECSDLERQAAAPFIAHADEMSASGQAREARSAYERAYEICRDPWLLAHVAITRVRSGADREGLEAMAQFDAIAPPLPEYPAAADESPAAAQARHQLAIVQEMQSMRELARLRAVASQAAPRPEVARAPPIEDASERSEPSSSPEDGHSPGTRSPLAYVGLATFGAGAVFTGLGVASVLNARTRHQDLRRDQADVNTLCMEQPAMCDSATRALNSRQETIDRRRNVGIAGAVIGNVMMVTGALLAVRYWDRDRSGRRDGHDEDDAEPAARLELKQCALGVGLLACAFQF